MLIFLVNNCESDMACSVDGGEYMYMTPHQRISFETEKEFVELRLRSPNGSGKEISSSNYKKGFFGSLFRRASKNDEIMKYDWIVAPESIFTVQDCRDFDEIILIRDQRNTESGITIDCCRIVIPSTARIAHFESRLVDCDEMEREYGEISRRNARKFFIMKILGELILDGAGTIILLLLAGLFLGIKEALLAAGGLFILGVGLIALMELPEYMHDRKFNPISECRKAEFINKYLIS